MRMLRALAALTLIAVATRTENGGSSKILEYKFRGSAQWPLQSGRLIDVSYEARKATRIQEKGSTLYQIDYPDVVRQIITSETDRSLLFLVYRERQTLGLDYSYLLTAWENEKGNLEFQKKLSREVSPMHKHQWVVELGAISDDAKTVLIKMAEADRNEAPYTVGSVWETWDLTLPRLLRTGLQLCD